MANKPKVVIIGGGFGGLQAAKALANKPVEVALIDRKNHHTFQPLLYQVATAVLSPGEIASPIRRILHKAKNVEVILGEAVAFDLEKQLVELHDGSEIPFDYLIVAAGARHSYFGHDEWETSAPGLKTIEDALEIRRRVLLAFELAEREAYLTGVKKHLNFVVIGGGATGVEMAGAIAGIARQALAKDFNLIDTRRALVQLFEGGDRILNAFDKSLSAHAKKDLEDLGVEVYLNSFVTEVEAGRVKVGDKWINCDVAVWATGVAASHLGKEFGAETDRAGRVFVNKDLTAANHKNIFVIGDMVNLLQTDGKPVPGVAPAAMQMAENAADNILRDLKGEARKDFKYFDKGSMATIGRNKAIVELGKLRLTGFIAWLAWLFVHVISLIGFKNRLYVLSEWFWAYLTRERSARLITGDAEELRDAMNFLEAKRIVAIAPDKPKKEKVKQTVKKKNIED
ncbi:MAG TPA: NAD(P)/FAD-dependent oxidoreductase [Pyrinomonadaceae bacterium]|nr:NAD(P)/FAD-dependent oxidoreductase [Pyrinomonadaceae bacterium]